MAFGKRPLLAIDLTGDDDERPSYTGKGKGVAGTRSLTMSLAAAAKPHAGPRKLFIKNLRGAPAISPGSTDDSLSKYLENAHNDLDEALTAIFESRPPRKPLDRLYRAVEDICLCRTGQDQPGMLARMVTARCETHLRTTVLARIRSQAPVGSEPVDALGVVLDHWKTWCEQLLQIRRVFSWLDRSYLMHNKEKLPLLNDMGIRAFRKMVFGKESKDVGLLESAQQRPGEAAIEGMCQLVYWDRRGPKEYFDPALLKESVSMLHVLNVYCKSFEARFLEDSANYFQIFAEEASQSSGLKGYISACEELLWAEDSRCMAYSFDSTTKRQLLDVAHNILVEKYATKFLDNGSVARLLDENEVESMKGLYDLLKLSGIQARLRDPWVEYVMKTGKAIVTDTERGDEMAVRLLGLRKRLDVVAREAFGKDKELSAALRKALEDVLNDKKLFSVWAIGVSKVGEVIAKHIDSLLRNGLKKLPPTLLTDGRDRHLAERKGQASTADEDAEMDRQLDMALELFRLIDCKDVFEEFYKRDLARRLLMGRTANEYAERSMINKLRDECGSEVTQHLEHMFQDQELTKDDMAAFITYMHNKQYEAGFELDVRVLRSSSWPTYPAVSCRVPTEVYREVEFFEKFYLEKHQGRKVEWRHNLSQCVLKARFERGEKELHLSAMQAVVLMLFNEVDAKSGHQEPSVLAYEQIKSATGLPAKELERTLQSLACGKARVLTKHPRGRDVHTTDTFTVNTKFWDPKAKIKINQIQLRETSEENAAAHERVVQDRQLEIQSAIVRTAKARKRLTHAELVASVMGLMSKRGDVDAGQIKRNVEKLVDKDYLERNDDGGYTYIS